MKVFVATVVHAVILLGALSVQAQAPAPTNAGDPFLSRIAGDWNGDGTFSRASSQGWAKWEAVLEGKFVRFSVNFEIKQKDSATRKFGGHGYYQVKGPGNFEGQWFDSEGHQYPIKATVSRDTMTTLWGIPGSVEGRSTYRLTDADKGLELIDSYKAKDGTWKELNRFTFRRN